MSRIKSGSGAPSRFMRVLSSADGRPRKRAKLYDIWDGMKKRCYTPSNGAYYHYGAKGIRVCDEWRTSYGAVRAWAISHGFRKGLTLDRIDGTGNYEPSNCRWATREEQTYNAKSVYKLTFNGVTKLMPVWAKELGFTPGQFRTRKRAGWTDEQILTTPRGSGRPGVLRGRAAAKAKRLLSGISPNGSEK